MKKINIEEMIGDTSLKLIVICEGERRNRERTVRVKCECGTVKDILLRSWRHKKPKSCGCIIPELTRKKFSTHGMSGTRIYHIWENMKQRCYNDTDSARYANYGGKGIKICDRWLNSFEYFMQDMGIPRDDQSIDRIDPYKDYTPDNCRWATVQEQNHNKYSYGEYKRKGVRKKYNKWEAIITFNKKQRYIGSFDTEEEAARAYDLKAIELYGHSIGNNEYEA